MIVVFITSGRQMNNFSYELLKQSFSMKTVFFSIHTFLQDARLLAGCCIGHNICLPIYLINKIS